MDSRRSTDPGVDDDLVLGEFGLDEPGDRWLQRIRAVQGKPRRIPVGRQQTRHKVPVQLDDLEPAAAVHQKLRQRAPARANLHQVLPGQRVYGVDNPVDNPRILQEVLAETLAGTVGGGWSAHGGLLYRYLANWLPHSLPAAAYLPALLTRGT